MLQIIAVYLLKVLICSALLLAYYWAALRNKRFHYYNRFYLLMAVVLSFTVPLLNLQWFSFSSNNTQAITLLNVIYGNGEEDLAIAGKGFKLNWQDIISLAALAITVFFLLVLAYRILKIYQIKKSFPVSKTDEFDFINTDIQEAPFSFLKNIFWRSDISLEEKTGQQILRHELAHIKQKHTWDKLFIQIVLAIFWMNPFYWLIQKELYLIHEFIADEKAVEDKDASAFAAMLLHAQFGKFMFAPAQSFFYSPIKRRLLMLTSSKKPSLSYVRRLMALPLLTFVVCLFAFRLHEDKATFAITKANAPFKLVVDAGHGGTDNGAAANGLLEKNINLSISKKIKELSGEYGINVVLTRDNDASATPPERVDWIKQQHADACVSIHVNATEASVTDSSGMELVVAKNNDNGYLQQSQLMGSAIWGQLSESFKVAPTLKQNNVGIWVLQANTVPAVLIECGYINNPGDAKKLTDAASIEKLARKILEGVAMYANKKGTTGDNKYYQGKKYKSVNIDAAAELVTMHFEDGSTKTISLHEAVKENIVQKTINLSGEDTTAPKPAPLYVIDGKISDKVQMEKIDPKDIKSVNVLKGESATTAYGDKGKNGVVEITTKNAVARPMNDSLLYVLDGKTVMAAEVNNLDPAKIISVNVLKDKDAVSKYGSKAKYGAVEITSVNKNDNTIDTVLPKTEPK